MAKQRAPSLRLFLSLWDHRKTPSPTPPSAAFELSLSFIWCAKTGTEEVSNGVSLLMACSLFLPKFCFSIGRKLPASLGQLSLPLSLCSGDSSDSSGSSGSSDSSDTSCSGVLFPLPSRALEGPQASAQRRSKREERGARTRLPAVPMVLRIQHVSKERDREKEREREEVRVRKERDEEKERERKEGSGSFSFGSLVPLQLLPADRGLHLNQKESSTQLSSNTETCNFTHS